jgi:hypothetical protein
MKKSACAFLFCGIPTAALAIIVSQFADTDSAIQRAKDIIIAECISIPTNKPVLVDGHWVTEELRDGLYKVEVNVVRTLKGDKQSGKQIIATIYTMTPGKKYLLSTLGGSVGEGGGIPGTDFLAVPQLSVLEIPASFDLSTLDHKDLKKQVQCIYSRHLFDVERQLAPLLAEKALLDKAVSDRSYEWYESSGPVKIGRIVDAATTNQHWSVWLNLGDKKLQWSGGMPGKNGYLYFEKAGESWKPYWEFSLCEAKKIEDLADKPLKSKFSGLFSPGTSGQSVQVTVGQVLLARTADDLRTIYILQIVGQDQSQKRMSARYAVIQR